MHAIDPLSSPGGRGRRRELIRADGERKIRIVAAGSVLFPDRSDFPLARLLAFPGPYYIRGTARRWSSAAILF